MLLWLQSDVHFQRVMTFKGEKKIPSLGHWDRYQARCCQFEHVCGILNNCGDNCKPLIRRLIITHNCLCYFYSTKHCRFLKLAHPVYKEHFGKISWTKIHSTFKSSKVQIYIYIPGQQRSRLTFAHSHNRKLGPPSQVKPVQQ